MHPFEPHLSPCGFVCIDTHKGLPSPSNHTGRSQFLFSVPLFIVFVVHKKTKAAWQGLLLLHFSHCCREKTSRDAWDLSATSKATKPGVTFLGVPWCTSWCLVIVYVGFASGARNRNLLLFVFLKGTLKNIFFLGAPGVDSENVTPTLEHVNLIFQRWQWVVFHCNIGRAGSGSATEKIISPNQTTTKSVYGVWFVQTLYNISIIFFFSQGTCRSQECLFYTSKDVHNSYTF